MKFQKIIPITSIALFIFLSTGLQAQDVDYTQYFANLAGVNPAFTGAEDGLDLKLGFRQGWNDFDTKNNNFYIGAYGSLSKEKKTSSPGNSLRISKPEFYKPAQSGKTNRRKHGLGGMISNRNFGPYQSININLNYAYHLPVSKSLNLSFGTKANFGNQRIDFSGYTVRDEINDTFYQQLINANQGNQNLASLDFGSALYSRQFYIAISTDRIISKKVGGNNLLNEKNDPRISLQTAVNIPLGVNFTFNPGAKATYSKFYDVTWMANARVRYKDLIYIGSGFNSEKKLSFLIGLSLNERFSINYAYDQYLSDLKDFNATMHELVIGVSLFRNDGTKTKFW